MENYLKDIYETIIVFINSSYLGPILSIFLVIIESMIPILPLFVFITIIFMAFGPVIGFIISWIATIIGCLISYKLSLLISNKYKFLNNDKLNKLKKRFNNIKFSTLTLIIAIPFTPAFLINIAAGLSNINFKKYLYSLLIGKISLIIFWGFIGTSLIESLTNIEVMIKIILILLFTYLLSKIISKKLKVN